MRTLLAFPLLILALCALCVGCPQVAPELNQANNAATNEPAETLEPHRPEPWIEPRFLPDGTPFIPGANPPTGSTPSEIIPEETTGILSPILGTYAVEFLPTPVPVPLPPVEDLTTQIDEYIKKMAESLELLDGSPRYASDASDIVRDANALALTALAVGLAEDDSKYKKSASRIIEAAQLLAAAKTLEEGLRAHAALKASLTMEGRNPLSWSDRVADLTPAMKALPNLSSAVKRVTDTERKLDIIVDRGRAPQVLGQIAAMAAISQGSIPNVAETEKPDAVEEWRRYCEEFRDAAIKVNAVTRQYAQGRADGKEPDYSIFRDAFRAMSASCDDCHRVFYPQAVGKE
jgi:hypothetical protein